jgi:hypothetical protein
MTSLTGAPAHLCDATQNNSNTSAVWYGGRLLTMFEVSAVGHGKAPSEQTLGSDMLRNILSHNCAF